MRGAPDTVKLSTTGRNVGGRAAAASSSATTSASGADVGADVRVVIAFAVDANELAFAIVERVAWSVAGGEGVCQRRKLHNT